MKRWMMILCAVSMVLVFAGNSCAKGLVSIENKCSPGPDGLYDSRYGGEKYLVVTITFVKPTRIGLREDFEKTFKLEYGDTKRLPVQDSWALLYAELEGSKHRVPKQLSNQDFNSMECEILTTVHGQYELKVLNPHNQ